MVQAAAGRNINCYRALTSPAPAAAAGARTRPIILSLNAPSSRNTEPHNPTLPDLATSSYLGTLHQPEAVASEEEGKL